MDADELDEGTTICGTLIQLIQDDGTLLGDEAVILFLRIISDGELAEIDRSGCDMAHLRELIIDVGEPPESPTPTSPAHHDPAITELRACARTRMDWNRHDELLLRRLILRFGVGRWKLMVPYFAGRSNVQLKDKFKRVSKGGWLHLTQRDLQTRGVAEAEQADVEPVVDDTLTREETEQANE